MRFIKSIFVSQRFYQVGVGLILLNILAFIWPKLYPVFVILFALYGVILLTDLVMLFLSKGVFHARRVCNPMFALGENNNVKIFVESSYKFPMVLEVIDEAPIQFQNRNLSFDLKLKAGEEKSIQYDLYARERGEYRFGRVNILCSSIFGLLRRRFSFDEKESIKVYPSIPHMKKTEFLLQSKNNLQAGIKKVRRPGYNFEFEEIKEYVTGDDMRKVNWRATARKRQLMVNVFQEEKSQPVYCIINKGRTMHMPFNGLSLFDYAVNSCLAVSNILLKKSDKAGLITFENSVDTFLAADARRFQLKLILEQLYKETTSYHEPNYYDLYSTIKQKLSRRSLLLIYSNFETRSLLDHQMALFKKLNQNHLVVVIMFENMELKEFIGSESDTLLDIYQHAIAEKFDLEKKMILKLFRTNGIQAILTNPHSLTIDVINKYLELKGRGVI